MAEEALLRVAVAILLVSGAGLHREGREGAEIATVSSLTPLVWKKPVKDPNLPSFSGDRVKRNTRADPLDRSPPHAPHKLQQGINGNLHFLSPAQNKICAAKGSLSRAQKNAV